MSSLAAKRQRIDAVSHALSKPFRSPMKTPLAANSPGNLSVRRSSDTVQQNGDDDTRVLDPTKRRTQLPSRTIVHRNPFSSPILSTNVEADLDIASLLKTQRQLEKQLRELKEELDTAEQARRIEMDSEKKNPGGAIDRELLQLILRWRAASREAVEELFTGVRDRVNRMGGPKAWKEMQERQKEFRSGWNTEPSQPDSDDEDGQGVERRDLYAEYDIDPENANEKEARECSGITEDGEAEDEFTMAMMLGSLNVPLSTIGYDKENQRWAD